jgi:diaminopimelate decarboxylase
VSDPGPELFTRVLVPCEPGNREYEFDFGDEVFVAVVSEAAAQVHATMTGLNFHAACENMAIQKAQMYAQMRQDRGK